MSTDTTRFDRVTRFLGQSSSRRAAVTALLAIAVAPLLSPSDAAGRRHGKRTVRQQGSKDRQRPPRGPQCDVCEDEDDCRFTSLQPAIDAAAAGDTIRICAGDYKSNRSIFITKNLTLAGAGADKTALEGGGFVRVLDISQGFVVTLRDLTLSGGFDNRTLVDGGGGGGILVRPGGKLTLERCRVEDNKGRDGGGIALGTGSALTMSDSVVSDNSTISVGGGIWVGQDATVTMAGSRVSNNKSTIWGGGIYVLGGTLVLKSGSRVEENKTKLLSGGGIYVSQRSTVTLEAGSRVTDNDADDGGGIWNDRATITIADDDIVTDNDPNNCGGTPIANCIN